MKKLLIHLSVLGLMVVALAIAQAIADSQSWRLPFYLVQELTLGAFPMIWLLVRVFPRFDPAQSWSFLFTSAVFIALACIFELLAVQYRYWTFYQKIDPLSGLMMGGVPLEEFLYYPILLNIPVLFYMHAQHSLPAWPPRPLDKLPRMLLMGGAVVSIAAGLVLLVLAFFRNEPPLDLNIQAQDIDGAIVYTAGPPKRSWTILQLLSLGVALLAYPRMRDRLHRSALWFTLAAFFLYGFTLEAMACGRGWWVWNSEQTSGIIIRVLPFDSFVMYITGVLLPILLFEKLRARFA